ncbi:hypothetical protein LX16_1674 [Stackebrandtia albiflava]|uniref:Alpha/beta hydrolase family protein n=1 Tax=Stackebrandtia albiflava TaxID=406432 RepID=A0A562VDJ5_9ACTN|nr:alpha/beta hydrolase [Stackebrandtia albiflava]TWJ15954.1 hypothetical protein LX16_1674 [Stackebrandtia albiflava]
MRLFLIPGGLWEPEMTAQRFWGHSGILPALTARGITCVAPDRLPRPADWDTDTAHLAEALPDGDVAIMAASNGTTPAIALARLLGRRLTALILAWPATCGDDRADRHTRAALSAAGATGDTIENLLTGQTLRGVTDARIRELSPPRAALIPAPPASPFHRRHTVTALSGLLPSAHVLPEFPEPPRPEFTGHTDRFASTVANWLRPAPGP